MPYKALIPLVLRFYRKDGCEYVSHQKTALSSGPSANHKRVQVYSSTSAQNRLGLAIDRSVEFYDLN